jgi:iron complex transport system substrate-binding protein
VIESKPQRVVSIAWENSAAPLALGLAPVGVAEANYGLVTENRIHPWTDEAFQSLGVDSPHVFNDTDGFDFEAISDAQPDLILAVNSGMTQEEYDILSEIAPTVAYPEKPWQVSWRDSALIASKAIGMEEEGKQLVKETEELIAEKAAEYPALADKKAIFCWISPDDLSTFSIYLPGDSRADYLNDFGLELPDSTRELAQTTSDFYINVSRENADQLSDVEMIVVYGNAANLETIQADALMNQIPAIKNGAGPLLTTPPLLRAGPLPVCCPPLQYRYLSETAERCS